MRIYVCLVPFLRHSGHKYVGDQSVFVYVSPRLTGKLSWPSVNRSSDLLCCLAIVGRDYLSLRSACFSEMRL